MPKSVLKALFLVLCFLTAPGHLFSQAGVASLSGLVTDPSSAIVSGAKVTARKRSTQIARTTTTDGSGYYNFVSLPVGTYQISVEQAGFDNKTQAVALDPSEKARQDFQLALQGTSSTVKVESSAPEISRDDSSIGTVISNETIISTPLFMRNLDDLIRLVPGVQAQRYTEQSGSTASGRTGSFNIHGIDSLQNNFIMDGIDNNTFSENVQELSTQAGRPSVDVIGEFKLISSPGAVVDVTTKTGTDQPVILGLCRSPCDSRSESISTLAQRPECRRGMQGRWDSVWIAGCAPASRAQPGSSLCGSPPKQPGPESTNSVRSSRFL